MKDVTDPTIRQAWSASPPRLLRRLKAGEFEAVSSVFSSEVGFTIDTELQLAQDLWDRAVLSGEVPNIDERLHSEKLNVLDLYCGCGGLSFGVRQAAKAVGFDVDFFAGYDSSPHVLEVYSRNISPRATKAVNVLESVDFQTAGRAETARFVGSPILLDSGLADLVDRVDMLLGGPPCQGYSNSNNHTRRDDPRNILYLTMPAIAVALKVPLVIIENVPEVIHDPRQVVPTARRLLENAGYYVGEAVLSALELGTPQRRRRHILIASKSRPPQVKGVADFLRVEARPIAWVLADLLEVEPTSSFDVPAVLSEENMARIKFLFENDLYETPNSLRPLSHKNGHTYPSVYGRLRWERSAGTITTGFMTPGRGRFIHPLRPRTLTPHEAARLQGFPDSFDFRMADDSVPAKTWLGQMIGEAVPPPMAFAAGLAALSAVNRADLTGHRG